jgi:hypothetical protein
VRDGRQTSSTWYDGKRFQFVVWDKLPYDRVTPATVTHTWGTLATVWYVG